MHRKTIEQTAIYLPLGESAKPSEGGESHTAVTQETTLSVTTDFPNQTVARPLGTSAYVQDVQFFSFWVPTNVQRGPLRASAKSPNEAKYQNVVAWG